MIDLQAEKLESCSNAWLCGLWCGCDTECDVVFDFMCDVACDDVVCDIVSLCVMLLMMVKVVVGWNDDFMLYRGLGNRHMDKWAFVLVESLLQWTTQLKLKMAYN